MFKNKCAVPHASISCRWWIYWIGRQKHDFNLSPARQAAQSSALPGVDKQSAENDLTDEVHGISWHWSSFENVERTWPNSSKVHKCPPSAKLLPVALAAFCLSKPRSPSGSNHFWSKGHHESDRFVRRYSEWQLAIPHLRLQNSSRVSWFGSRKLVEFFSAWDKPCLKAKGTASRNATDVHLRNLTVSLGLGMVGRCWAIMGHPLHCEMRTRQSLKTTPAAYISPCPPYHKTQLVASTGSSQSLVATMLRVTAKRRCLHQGFDLAHLRICRNPTRIDNLDMCKL